MARRPDGSAGMGPAVTGDRGRDPDDIRPAPEAGERHVPEPGRPAEPHDDLHRGHRSGGVLAPSAGAGWAGEWFTCTVPGCAHRERALPDGTITVEFCPQHDVVLRRDRPGPRDC
jgi:hypothetical protein